MEMWLYMNRVVLNVKCLTGGVIYRIFTSDWLDHRSQVHLEQLDGGLSLGSSGFV